MEDRVHVQGGKSTYRNSIYDSLNFKMTRVLCDDELLFLTAGADTPIICTHAGLDNYYANSN